MSERVTLTTDAGAPIGDNQNAITAGTGGDLSGGAARRMRPTIGDAGPDPGGGFYDKPNINVGHVNPVRGGSP